jgi:hypothetical protein
MNLALGVQLIQEAANLIQNEPSPSKVSLCLDKVCTMLVFLR